MSENILIQIQEQAKELWKKQIELQEQAREYCKDKKFKIVKPIYYSGYQNNLQGRECYIKPYIDFLVPYIIKKPRKLIFRIITVMI